MVQRPQSARSHECLGREDVLTLIAATFDGGARAVTLTGLGGVGKTCIAIAHARTEAAAGRRIFWCDLSGARSSADLCAEVSRVLGLRSDDAGTTELVGRIGRALARAGRPLLVLDTFEQLEDGAADLVAYWLHTAHKASVLITSRRATGIVHERLVAVEPLTLADASDGTPGPAAALFLARASTRQHGDISWERERGLVTAIVTRLEGLPLAVELAAARLDVVSLAALARLLDSRFLALRDPLAGAERQGTLWRALEWSWQLLTPWQRDALAQLGVFEGELDLDSACAVLRLPPMTEGPTAIDALQALARQSLLRVVVDGERDDAPAFVLSDTVREFARAKLDPSAAVATRERLAAYMTQRGQAAATALEEHGDAGARRWLERSYGDLLALVRTRLEGSHAGVSDAQATAAMLALNPLLTARWSPSDHLALLESVAAIASGSDLVPPGDTALLMRAWINRLVTLGRSDEALALMGVALPLAATARAPAVEALLACDTIHCLLSRGELEAADATAMCAREVVAQPALAGTRVAGLVFFYSSYVASERGAFADGRDWAQRALAILGRTGSGRDEARARMSLAVAAYEIGDEATAQFELTQAARLYDEDGDRLNATVARGLLAGLAHRSERFTEAHTEYANVRDAFAELGHRRLEAVYRGYVGIVELQSGRAETAEPAITAALETLVAVGDVRYEAVMLAALSGIRALAGDVVGAEAWLTRADERARAFGNPQSARVIDVYRGVMAAAGGALEDARRYLRELEGAPVEDVYLAIPLLRRAVHEAEERSRAWSFAPEGAGFRAPGRDVVTLESRPPLRRLLWTLVRARMDRYGQVVPRAELVAATWPDEPRLVPTAAANRLKVAVATLRKFGLESMIIARDGGYFMAANVPIRVDEGLIQYASVRPARAVSGE